MESLPPDQDVDMEAPQISTLRDETPPPPTRRVKLLVKDTRGTAGQASSSARKRALSVDEDEDEDEEDQLIDDDDVVPRIVVPPAVTPSAAADTTTPAPARRKPPKRRPRKSEKKQAEEDRQTAEKLMQAGGPMAPTMTWFEVSPAKAHPSPGQMGTLDVAAPSPAGGSLNIVSLDAGAPSKPPPRKKAAVGKKPQAVPRPRAKPGPKAKTVAAALLPLAPEDTTDVVSEAGYSVTAASSPVTNHFENNTPEPEPLPPSSSAAAAVAVPSAPDDPPMNLQDTPLPQYPLPIKPFSVQPPQKINTGFAPSMPLDRSGTKVRHWRVVQREIRGIAGGRWFTRTWVGAKESPFALTVMAGGDKPGTSVQLPKLPAVSISSGSTKTPKAKATPKKPVSVNPSTEPSRSNSAVPSKMRLAPMSDGGDSDMVAAPGA